MIFAVLILIAELSVLPIGNPVSRIATPPGIGAVQVICEGDSITAGFGSVPYSTYLAAIWPGAFMNNVSQSADVLGYSGDSVGLFSEFAAQITPQAPATSGYSKVLMCLCIGTNDIGTDGVDNTTLYTRIKVYWAQTRALGIKIVALTIPPRTGAWDSTKESKRVAFNASVRADPSLYDALIDLDIVTPDSTDLTIFQPDGLHLTAAGELAVANYIAAHVNPSNL